MQRHRAPHLGAEQTGERRGADGGVIALAVAGEQVADVVEQRRGDEGRGRARRLRQCRALHRVVALAEALAVLLAAARGIERGEIGQARERRQQLPSPARIAPTTPFNARIIVLRRRSCWHRRKPCSA